MANYEADHARLVADLEADDPEAIAWAYRRVFSGPVGKLILTHQLAEAGVGAIRGVNLTAEESRYHDGRADHALRVLTLAGYGRMSAAHAVAADILEGQDHDGHPNAHARAFSGPDADAYADPDADPDALSVA
ncbi:MAG: hypothetical protein K2X61_04720 [Caulobacteraceae bacterium]|nr:hypothetical protein [Caulobacteraceae bacterium]